MSQSIPNNFPAAAPMPHDLIAPAATVSQSAAAPSVKPTSAARMPDGSWADAQVELSAAASSDPIVAMYQAQIETDNFLFTQQMFAMQQRQAATARALQVKTSSVADVKPVTGPEIKGADSGDDGGEGGEGGGEE